MNLHPNRLVALTGLLLGALLSVAHAERVSPRPAMFGADGERVIVRFKPEATVLRAHRLSAGNPASHAGTLEQRAATLGARHGLALRAGAGIAERVQVVSAAGLSARELAARLARDGDVEYAEPDRRARRTAVPNDPRFASVAGSGPAVGQWYLRAPAGEAVSSIDAVSAWDTTTGSAATIVAVLDTGVRFDHPDLAGKLLAGYDMVSDATVGNDSDGRDADPSDPGDWINSTDLANPTFNGCELSSSSWHGTQVSGIIGAATNNGVGMAGAGWNVRVLPLRVLGKCYGFTSDIAAAIRWAAGLPVPGVPANPNPAQVINLSLGSDGACSQVEQDAVNAAVAAGSVVVAAAGNTAGRAASSPSNCTGVIGVAALRHAGSKVGFSDVGPELSIAAPGGNCVNIGPGEPCLYPILTTVNLGGTVPGASGYTDSFDFSVGTSFSSPLVAATAALMLSAQPSLTPAGVRAAMRATARPFPQSGLPDDPTTGPLQPCHAPDNRDQLQCYCTSTTCGAGMLDAGASVRAALGIRVAIAVTPAAPQAGQAVTFDSAGSTVASGRTIASRQWTIVNGGGIATSFSGATNAATATLTPSAAGSFTVRLTVTDDLGVAASQTQTVNVGAAPAPPPSASGGGGAMSWAWMLGLALAVAGVARTRPSRGSR
jgi:serine protease